MDGVQLSEGYEETVFFLPLTYQEILVLIWYFSTQSMSHTRMKGKVDLGAAQWFWIWGPRIGNLAP